MAPPEGYCHTAGRLTCGSQWVSESAHSEPSSRGSVFLTGFLAGAGDCSFPSWLRSLMTISCCVTDCFLQNVAISTLLEVINHSQSLALVIEDKMKRYKSSGHNPFFGKLQMVTVPPIAPGILKVIAEKTDFYQVSPTGRRWARPSSQPSVQSCPRRGGHRDMVALMTAPEGCLRPVPALSVPLSQAAAVSGSAQF